MHFLLSQRLQYIWPLPRDHVYYELLNFLFPLILHKYPSIPLDEFGPEMYHNKKIARNPSIFLVLERMKEKGTCWVLIASSDWIKTHKKISPPIWLLESDILSCNRLSRNEMFLEVQKIKPVKGNNI